MSTIIDERVVEMRFDNRNFENNVKTTLSTLDKLKLKLNLPGASKSLEKLGAAANNVNMNGLSSAVSTIQTKFSAMEIVAVTALANITNSAVNAGKRMVSALTIDPITTGFKEYETQMNAVQTILANTQKEGTNVAIVNKALDELNEYADMTIYNFTEMTRNIGTFTAAGVKLDDSVKAIKGIANLAAVSGSTSQQASTAMYQLSQALSSGTVRLMDWNSVVNAGMGGQVFQDALKETARVHGVAVDKIIEQEGSFRDSLQKGWLSSEILTETLEHFTMAAEEGSEKWNEFKKSLKDKGYTDAQAEAILKLGTTATEAATKVKTFTQLWDVLKEAAQSGWAQSWRIIVGDFEEAKALLTPLSDFLTGIINNFSQARNRLLEGALGKNPFAALFAKISDSSVIKTASNVADKINGITKSLEYYQDMVNKVWRGDYKNQPYRFGLLEADGHDPRVIQNLVNKGYRYKLTVDDVAAAEKKYGVVASETTDVADKMVETLQELTDEKLRELGLTDEEIKIYRQLEEQSKRTGKSIEEILKSMEQRTGRELLIDSFKNFGLSLVSIFNSVGEAWRNAFPAMTVFQLYSIIEGLNRFSVTIKTNVEKNADKLTRTLKGLFAILDLIAMVAGGGIRIAFSILKTILGMFNLDILGFTAIIGDAIVKFRDWIDQFNPVTIAIKKITPLVIKMGEAIGKFAKQLWELPAVQSFVEKITNAFKKLGNIKLADVISMLKNLGSQIKKVFSNINEHFNGVPGDILSGLVNGLKGGATKVINTIVDLANKLITKFKEILGIHSPSKVFFAIGGFIIAGLIGGLLSGIPGLKDATGDIVGKITGFIGNIDWSKIFTTGMSFGILLIAKNLSDTIKNFSSLAGGLGNMFYGFGDVASELADGMDRITKSVSKTIKSFGKVMKGIAFKKTAEGIKELAWSILIIAGAVYLLAQLDYGKLWSAVGAIAVLGGILAALAFGVSKLSESSLQIDKDGLKLGGIKASLMGIGAAILMLGLVVKLMGGMTPEEMKQGFLGLAGAVLALAGFMAAYGLLVKGKAAQNMDKAGKMLKKMAWTLLLLVAAVKLISLLEWSEMGKGAAFMAGFVAFVGLLMLVTSKSNKNIDKVGKAISKISWALLLMIAVVKLASLLEYSEMLKGAVFLGGFIVFVGLLVAVSKIGKEQQIAKVGRTVLAISGALLIMVGVVALCGLMSPEMLKKGLLCITLFGAVIAGLLLMVKMIGPQAPKLAGTIAAMGLAIGILAAVAIILSLVSIEGLKKGVTAVALLGAVMSLMIVATRGAGEVKGSIIAMAIAIGVMAAAVGILSFIKPEKLYSAVGAISILMGMFALIEHQSKNVTGSWQCLLTMTGAIAVLATAIGLLALLPVENTIGAALALSILMGAMAVVMSIISKFPTGKAALQGALALSAICIPLVALVGVLYLAKNIDDAIGTATSLAGLLIVMTGVLVVLTVIGTTGPAALIGIASLLALIVALTGVVVAIGALMSKYPALQDFLDKGLSALIQLAGGLGEMIGAFVKGALTQISAGLPQIGANLSMFMTNALPFINGAKLVDGAVLKGVGVLTAAILAFTGASLIEGIASFLPFIGSFADLGTELSVFMSNALPFIQSAMLIPPNSLDGVKTLTEAVLLITKANVLDGIARLLGSGSSLEKFANEIPHLATGINNFISTLGPINEAQVTTAKNAAEIIKTLASAAAEIPNTGGLLGELVGNNDMGPWSEQLPNVAKGIVGFVNTMAEGGISSGAIETANTAAEMIKTLAKASSEIPNTGGLLAKLVGDNPLDKFAEGLPNVGSGIAGFINTLLGGNVNSGSVETAKIAADVINRLAEVSQQIPDTGGFLAKLVGDNDLSKFASKLPQVGTGIAGFANNLGTFNQDKVATVTSAADAIRSVAELGKINLQYLGANLEGFGENVKTFGSKIKSFVDIIGSIGADNITASVVKLRTLVDSLCDTANTKADQIKLLGESLKDVAKEGVKGFVGTFTNNVTTEAAKNCMKVMIRAAISGAEDTKQEVTDKFTEIASAALNALITQQLLVDAESAGKYLVVGFTNGIKNNSYLAYNAGSAIGKAALNAAKEAIDSHSPSREAMKIGNYFGEGFVIGIKDYASDVYNVSSDVANNAKKGLSNAISKIATAINSDMDTQPTIRPVLDLSDVKSGAGYLNSMFNTSPSIGVMSNIKAISSGMNARAQNGANGDVVSAIDELSKKLGGAVGTTNNYNVNGVTYDDGSNIANAVETLIRATIVEGRR